VCEEAAYRGYLLQNVGERFPLWMAVLTTGGVFAGSHFAAVGFGVGFVVAGVLGSFLLTEMRLATRAIWLGVGWHLGWDWIQDGVGLVPGYSALVTERSGPALWVGSGMSIEGGLLAIVTLASALCVLHLALRAAGAVIDWQASFDGSGEPYRGGEEHPAVVEEPRP
jgi:membrane protease YdiL (CAAX protease family)